MYRVKEVEATTEFLVKDDCLYRPYNPHGSFRGDLLNASELNFGWNQAEVLNPVLGVSLLW